MGATLLMPGCAVASSRRAALGAPADDAGRATFERFVDLFYRRHQVRAAFESCVVASGFRDHGHADGGSRAAIMGSLSRMVGESDGEVTLLHTAFDGDIGMVHLQVRGPGTAPPKARVEIFRLDAGRIVEHWSVA